MIVKGIERNAFNLYEARRKLLGVGGERVPVVQSTVSDGPSTSSLNISNIGKLKASPQGLCPGQLLVSFFFYQCWLSLTNDLTS